MNRLILTAALGAVAAREFGETQVIRDRSDGDFYPMLSADTHNDERPRSRGRSNAASIKRQAAKARNVRKRSRR